MIVNVIPDLHGRDVWKKLIEKKADTYVFLGDYCDSWDISNTNIIKNLQEIVDFKKANPDSVILLLGNHEFHYLYPYDPLYNCSGIRPEIIHDLHIILSSNKALFQNAFQYKKYIFTHAGVQMGWFKQRFKGDPTGHIAEQLNNPESSEQYETLFDVGYRRWGRFPVGGIFWCDKNELRKPLRGFTQVVGHTPVKELIKHEYGTGKVLFCDYLETRSDHLILQI